MILARIEQGAVAEYPYDEQQLRGAHPQTSFRDDLTGMDLSEFGVVAVAANPAPGGLLPGQVAEQGLPVQDIAGVWTQNWSVREGTADELGAAKAARWAAVKARREVAIAAGAAVPGLGMVQTDAASLENISQAVLGAVLAAVTGQPFTIEFTLANNMRPTLNGVQMMGLGKLVGERKSACHTRAASLRAAIEGAADFAGLASIDIDGGWPA